MERIPQYIPEGYCLACRGCCRFASSDSSWVPRLLEEEAHLLTQMRIVPDPAHAGFVCAFLRPDSNSCTVYERRPFECQLYPFLLCRAQERLFLGVDAGCVFVSENRHRPEFQAFACQLLKHLQTPAIAEVLRNDRHLFQTYEGVIEIGPLQL